MDPIHERGIRGAWSRRRVAAASSSRGTCGQVQDWPITAEGVKEEGNAMSDTKRNKRRHGLGNITRLGGKWRVRLMVGGTQHSYTVEAPDRKAVEAFAKTKHAELEKAQKRTLSGFETGVRFSALLERFER